MSSPLVNVVIPANENNFSYGRNGYSIQKITIHHMAGIMSAEDCGYLFQNPYRETSSNYGIGVNGEIGLYVAEENTSYCDSNWVSNCTSITIENSNDSVGGDWHISDATLNSLIKLCADISKRNGLGLLVPGQNLTWHSMYTATTCPGDYLRSRMQYIADEVNKLLTSNITLQGHVAYDGWLDPVGEDEWCGTRGQSKQLEALKINTEKAGFTIDEIDLHIAWDGWKSYKKPSKDEVLGTTGEKKAIECIRIKALKEDGSPRLRFRVHQSMFGDTCWTLSDGISTLGSVGQSLPLEAIEMELI